MQYPNWKNGHKDIFHEKEPQYPVYSLPFRAGTSYANQYLEDNLDNLKSLKKRLEHENGKLV